MRCAPRTRLLVGEIRSVLTVRLGGGTLAAMTIQLTGERHRVGELGMMRQPDPRKPDVTAITA